MSCEACGWAAAICSMLAFGSFGVPIKSEAARAVDIDPLVFQSYKTFMCFATSWLILLTGQEFTFTPWGIVSGLFWVPNGTATIYAIKAAGLASAIGITSSCIVLSSFIWGIFVFQEKVHSIAGACFAVCCLMLGLTGMSYYSSPEVKAGQEDSVRASQQLLEVARMSNDLSSSEDSDDSTVEKEPAGNNPSLTKRKRKSVRFSGIRSNSSSDKDCTVDEETSALMEDQKLLISSGGETVVVFGRKLPKREWGMLLAGTCGLWGGSVMAPMKLCPTDTKGSRYLLSFSIGASIVTLASWLVRFAYNTHQHKSLSKAYAALPSFHIRAMWLPGGISGLLWSIGNFFSLISVYYLGQGVGYSLVQASILVSGLWGIFYFKEVQGTKRISKWLFSSLLTLCGILMLSYEHVDE